MSRSLLATILLLSCGCGSAEDLSGPSQPGTDAGADIAVDGPGADADDASDQDASGSDAPNPDAVGDASGITADQACDHLATALCAQLESCGPLLVDLAYGEVTTCRTVLMSSCVEALALPDTAKTPDWTDECAEALETWTCEDLLTRKTPSACLPPPGPRTDGTLCGEDGQCASGYCGLVPDELCGRCRSRAPQGAACMSDDDCDMGMMCTVDEVCAPYAPQGAPCSDDQPCAPWLSCSTTPPPPGQRRCVEVAGAGQPCDSEGNGRPHCDLLNGYFCNGVTHVCQSFELASPGDTCGVLLDGYGLCVGGSFCDLLGLTGTCLAPGEAGDPCSVEEGPWCQPGLGCAEDACHAYEPQSCN